MSENLAIGADRVVSVRYTLSIEGDTIESGDIHYLHGHSNIIPGLESALEGAAVGQKLDVEVPPGLAYGERADVELQRVPRENFPPQADIVAGMQFHARGPGGEVVPVWVAAVEEEVVVIDLNHPLAGATLRFDVEVLSVRAGTEEEIAHGHTHGEGGHDHG